MIETSATMPHERSPLIYGGIRSRHVYAPTKPRLTRFVSQAVVGSMFAIFALVVIRILIVFHPYSSVFVVILPILLAVALVISMPAGLIIWACARVADGPLGRASRSVIAIVVLATAWGVVRLTFSSERMQLDEHLWVLGSIVFTGITIGLVTGSRLQPWRALIRGSDMVGVKPTVLAGISGFLLRVTVVFLFMESVITLISILQSHYSTEDLVWTAIIFSHFTTSLFVVFARMRFWLLLTLAVIIAAPVIAMPFWFQEMAVVAQYVVIGHLALWAIFLLSRSRQMYSALSAINKEIRYYLID